MPDAAGSHQQKPLLCVIQPSPVCRHMSAVVCILQVIQYGSVGHCRSLVVGFSVWVCQWNVFLVEFLCVLLQLELSAERRQVSPWRHCLTQQLAPGMILLLQQLVYEVNLCSTSSLCVAVAG